MRQSDESRGTGSAAGSAAERIRLAATAAFAEHGYGGTSTRDIARRLGLSAAAMYPHYASKEALLFAISLEGHDDVLRHMREADDPTALPGERLRRLVSAFTRWQATRNTLARVVQYELRGLTPEHYRAIARRRQEVTRLLGAVIEEGKRTGEFSVADTDGALLAISSLCVDVCRWFPSRTHRDPERLAELYAEIALRIVV